jgi:uncharacterized membrane protein YoaK (UPF0700 family)
MFVWLLMAFQAGYINVGGFFISGNFVSHVTGTSSNIGIGFANLDLYSLLTFLTILFAFIGGAAFAGKYIGWYKEIGKGPRYVFVTAVKAFFFFMILLLSELDAQNTLHLSQTTVNTLIIFFLSFCCGAQNSTCAQATNGFLKPTHMTGLSTDIGMNLVRQFYKRGSTDPKDRELIKKNNIRLSILGSFIFGGLIAAMIFQENGHHGFIFPFLSSLTFLMLGMIYEKESILENHILLRALKVSLMTIFVATIAIGIRG